MGFKIAVSGKGGVGKSTLAAMLAHLAAAQGMRVLAIDADPDANLAAALGIPASLRQQIIPLAQRRTLIEERTGAKVKQYGQIFKLNPEVSDIAEKESALFRSIHLLTLGAVESGGSGCACPESVLLRSLLLDAVIYKDDCVILDMEAGLEHLGRATAQAVDLILVVVEPGTRAVETFTAIQRMASDIGIRQVAVVGSKVSNPADADFLQNAFPNGYLLGLIPFHETIRKADREDTPLIDIADSDLRDCFQGIWKRIQERLQS